MEYPNFRLDNQVALVTGASMGIGFGLAKALAKAGAKVALAARTVEALTQLAAEIRTEGGEAEGSQAERLAVGVGGGLLATLGEAGV